MNWRPWVVTAVLLMAGTVNAGLLWFEEIPTPEKKADLENAKTDPLRSIAFTAGQRRSNLSRMGLSDELVGATAKEIEEIWNTRKTHLEEMLREAVDEVAPVICVASERALPQRYALMAFLVEENAGSRRPIPVDRLAVLEEGEWWASARAADVFSALELTKDRREDATLMGVSAVLLAREADATRRASPWGTGLGLLSRWSYDQLEDENPQLRRQVIAYFALMHLLTELAFAPDGICS